MTEKTKYFGTDGIRGRVGLFPVNPEFVLKLGWAFGRVLAADSRKKVVIGKDTRISGYMLESALEAGFSAAGIDVYLLGPMPTPAVAYLTQTLRAAAGIVISASHNPFEDNGIKFFMADGSKLPEQIERAIEEEIDKPLEVVSSLQLGKVRRINDATGRYIEFCKATIPSLTRLTGLKIVMDSANGATYHIAPHVFTELGAEVVSIADKPDGFNINWQCGSTDTEALRLKVLETGADLGIAVDGDGDRVHLIDNQGRLLDGDEVLYIIAKDRQQRGVLNDSGVVGTLMSNYGLEKAITRMGIPFIRTNVGDRYILETLKEKQWILGGEPSGHIVCLDKTTTGDGLIAALQVLACMVKQSKSLRELTEGIELYPQKLINIKTMHANDLVNNSRVISLVEDLNKELMPNGRILLRPSGTEPVLRVMVEGKNEQEVQNKAEFLVDFLMGIAARDFAS